MVIWKGTTWTTMTNYGFQWVVRRTERSADILRSDNFWISDHLMEKTQKRICKQLGNESSYQSVLNTQKKGAMPFCPVNQDHIQLLHDGPNHWFLSFCSSDRVQICDCLKTRLNCVSMKCVYALYRNMESPYPLFYHCKNRQTGMSVIRFRLILTWFVVWRSSNLHISLNCVKIEDCYWVIYDQCSNYWETS